MIHPHLVLQPFLSSFGEAHSPHFMPALGGLNTVVIMSKSSANHKYVSHSGQYMVTTSLILLRMILSLLCYDNCTMSSQRMEKEDKIVPPSFHVLLLMIIRNLLSSVPINLCQNIAF